MYTCRVFALLISSTTLLLLQLCFASLSPSYSFVETAIPPSPHTFSPEDVCAYSRADDLEEEREVITELHNIFHNNTGVDESFLRMDGETSVCCVVGVRCHAVNESGPNRVSILSSKPVGAIYFGRTYIPVSVSRLRFLTIFDFRDCRITHVEPGALDEQRTLEEILMSWNSISDLTGLTNPNVAVLFLGRNALVSPKGLENMVNLNTLILSHNPKLFPPSTIASAGGPSVVWSKLKKLQLIHLTATNLHTLSPDFCSLVSIKVLILNFNPLSYLPDCFSMLENIETLSLEQTKLSKFPKVLGSLPNLSTLWLFPNSIEEFPEDIGTFPMLSVLSVSGPNLRVIRGLGGAYGIMAVRIRDTPDLIQIDASGLAGRRLNSFFVERAPQLKKVPSLSLAFSLREVSFDDTGIEQFELTDDYSQLYLSSLKITNSRLKHITTTEHSNRQSAPNMRITELDLSNNDIDHISVDACRFFEKVQLLDLSDNPLRNASLQACATSGTVTVRNSLIERLYTLLGEVDASNCSKLVGLETFPSSALDLDTRVIDMRGEFKLRFENTYIANRALTQRLESHLDYKIDLVYEKKVYCYDVIVVNPLSFKTIARIRINPQQLEFRHCRCVDDNMYWDAREEVCRGAESVPPEMFCTYNDSVTKPLHAVRAGFYPIARPGANASSGIYSGSGAKFHSLCTVSPENLPMCGFIECIQADRCNPGEESLYSCSGNFDEESVMCSRCKDGFFESAHSCLECTTFNKVSVLLGFFLAIVVLIVYSIKAHDRDSSKSVTFGTVSIFLSYVQMSYIFTWISITTDASASTASVSRWWEGVSGLFYALVPSSASCLFSGFDYINFSYVIFSVPLVLLLALVIISSFMLGMGLLSHHRISMVVYFYLFVLQTSYLGLSARVLSVFNCIDTGVNNISVLVLDPSVSCDSTPYLNLRITAICGVFLYILGIPALLFSVVRLGLSGNAMPVSRSPSPFSSDDEMVATRNGKGSLTQSLLAGEDEEENLESHELLPLLLPSFRMLGSCHRQKYPYWGVTVVMLRRLLIVCTVSLFHPRSVLIPVFILFLVLVSLLIQWEYRPYAHRIDNVLETGFLSLAYFTYSTGTFASAGLYDVDVIFSIAVFLNITAVFSFCIMIPLTRLGVLRISIDMPEHEPDSQGNASCPTSPLP